jgi:hypothetical protein
MVIRDVEIDQTDNKIFKGLLKAEAVACLIQYSSMKVTVKSRAKQKLQLQYKITIFAPRESYKDVAGSKFVEVITALKTVIPAGACEQLYLIDDIREFNTPEFLIDVVAIPLLVAFDVVL